jgi:hypothetical protein
MTRADAQLLAERARAGQGVPGDFAVVSAQQRFIEIVEDPPGESTRVRDVLVWAVRFAKGISFVELAVADRTGAVIRVRKSRGCA